MQIETQHADGAITAQLKDIVARQEVSIEQSQAVVMRLQMDNTALLARVLELETSLAAKPEPFTADVVCACSWPGRA